MDMVEDLWDPAGWVMDMVEDLEETAPWDTGLSPVILAGNSTLLRSKYPGQIYFTGKIPFIWESSRIWILYAKDKILIHKC